MISSCGGGGGGGGSQTPSVPFAISLGLTSFSLDEDSSFTGSIAATANEAVTFSYSIDSQAQNGSVTLSSTGPQITYKPNVNFNGTLKQNGTELNLTPLSNFNVRSDVSMNSLYLGNIPTTTTSTAQYNVAVGETALKSVTEGKENTSVGYDSLSANTTGSSNVSVGYQSLLTNTSGSNNVGVGRHSLKRLVSPLKKNKFHP